MLTKIMSAAGHLNIYAQVALVLFVLAFVSVLLRERLRSRAEVKHLENLPLRDGTERDEQEAA